MFTKTCHTLASILLSAAAFVAISSAQGFVHPGCLSDQTDINRMITHVNAGDQPWLGGWNNLTSNTFAQSNRVPHPVADVVRGCSPTCTNNYTSCMQDAATAYQNALEYVITGNTAYANCAVNVLNAWASTLTTIDHCCSDHFLLAGLQGYQFASAAELLRNYPGWAPSDFSNFQNWMLNVWYPENHDFLTNHNGACISHYWANWDLCNMASMICIGVLCDNQAIFDEAVSYYQTGAGNGALAQLLPYYYGPGSAQWQESGRDQGHTKLGVGLAGVICEVVWKQGVDLYGFSAANGMYFDGMEYVSSYNLGNTVPYTTYNNCDNVNQTVIATGGRGTGGDNWDMEFNGYVREGLVPTYTGQMAALSRPDYPGGHWSTGASWAFDSIGAETLTHYLGAPTLTDADIGGPGQAGGASFGGGTWTVSGGGADIWGTSDAFNYAYAAVSGDCSIVARVTSVQNTNAWAKAGVMIREALDASSTHALVAVTPGNGVAFQRRINTGGSSSDTHLPGLVAPYWVRLVRSGNTFTAMCSPNGGTWTTIGSASINMASAAYIGLAVTAHDDTQLCTALFDNTTTTP